MPARRRRKLASPKQAITTKYAGPTNSRGSRVIASSASGIKVTIPWDHEFDDFENHVIAAEALQKKLGWTGALIGGGVKDGYVFVFKK
jgi:hypothetical protein